MAKWMTLVSILTIAATVLGQGSPDYFDDFSSPKMADVRLYPHFYSHNKSPYVADGSKEDNDHIAAEQFSFKEKCHAKVLQTCGIDVIEGFSKPDLNLAKKCQIRETFLHCMIKLKKRSCRSLSVRDMIDDDINAFRQQILQLLWSARGCVLGIEIP